MSRTKRSGGTTSPIKKYLQFSGSTGIFSYYDKEAKERVELDELEIVVLDVRASITGYDSATKAQFTSNLVAETGKEILKVVSWKDNKPTNVAEGLYKEIKDAVKSAGGKFTTNVICLCDVGNGQEICNLQVQGASLNGWINFMDTLDRGEEYDKVITISRGALSKLDGKNFVAVTDKEEKALDAKLKKNPRAPQPIWFYVLQFDTEDLSEEQVDMATEEDEKVQKYFVSLGGDTAKKESEVVEEEVVYEEEEVQEEGDVDNVPF